MSDFKREARYYVIKIKDLSEDQDIALCDLLSGARIPCTDCVVVESDWPNYEHTWKTIERVSDSSYSDPYAEIERWKKTTHDQAEAISELQGLVHQQRQGADICRCVGPGNGCCCDICEPSPPSDRMAEAQARVAELESSLAYRRVIIEKAFILRKQAEAVVALARLESACESRAKSTTEDLYDQMTRIPGMVEALHELDNARRHARDLLADLDNMEKGS